MEIITYPIRLKAFIRVNDEVAKTNNIEIEQLVVHELTHIILNAIRDEVMFEVSITGHDNTEEYRQRLTEKIEVAVEHLSRVLYAIHSK